MHEPSYQEKIWHVVSMIPKGKVATYGQVAELAGLPRMAIAVGRTLSKLPKGTELPWFRVINAKGMISFPVDSEAYLRQRDLLAEEGITLLNGKINLKTHRWIP